MQGGIGEGAHRGVRLARQSHAVLSTSADRHPPRHRTCLRPCCWVDAAEISFRDVVLDRVGEGGNGDLTGQRRALAQAGKVDGEHRAFAGQRGDYQVSVVQVGDTVNE